MAIMPSLVTARKQPRCGAPRPPGDLGREIEVGLNSGFAASGMERNDGHLSDRPACFRVEPTRQQQGAGSLHNQVCQCSRRTPSLGAFIRHHRCSAFD
jgi:hypothetical protein